MSKEILRDPDEGLRIAYLSLNSSHTVHDFEDWRTKLDPGDGKIGVYKVFVLTCELAIRSNSAFNPDQERSIVYAAGYYTGMAVTALAFELAASRIEN